MLQLFSWKLCTSDVILHSEALCWCCVTLLTCCQVLCHGGYLYCYPLWLAFLITVAKKDRDCEDMCQLSQSRGLLPSHRADTLWRGISGRCATCGWVTWRPVSPVLSLAQMPGVCSTTTVRPAGQRLCSPQGLLSEYDSMVRWGCSVLWHLLRILEPWVSRNESWISTLSFFKNATCQLHLPFMSDSSGAM